MSDRLRNNASFLDLATRASDKQCKQLACTASNDQVDTISELCFNLTRGNITNIPAPLLRQLQKFRSDIYTLADHKVPRYEKRRILEQRGGVFPIVAALAPFIGSALGALGERIFRR
jgi:hypothetical protein